jgi:hypothetical protein
MAIGLGLLVVTSVPLGSGGSAASAPQAEVGRTDTSAAGGSPGASIPAGQPAAGGAESLAPVFGKSAAPSPLATTVPDKATSSGGALAPAEGPRTSGEQSQPTPTRDLAQPPTTNWPIAGLLLALVGFGLFLARGYARRHAEDPLLR